MSAASGRTNDAFDEKGCIVSRPEDFSAATVRVKNTAQSAYRGQTLTVIETSQWGDKLSYLCEMPGLPYPGWFQEREVERVEA